MSQMRSAIEHYEMIAEGDKICVGVSGGKDSVALLTALANMRRYLPWKFEVYALSLNMNFGGKPTDFSEIAELCRRLRVPYVVKDTQIGEIIFDVRKEENPCSLCARMRRGALHDAAKEMGCNKIALGHHLDDAVETFYLNLLRGGQIGSFSPVTYLSRKDITMIRPMIYSFEKDVTHAARGANLPICKSTCPADGNTERQRVKELIRSLEKDYDALRKKTITALQNAELDGWHG